MRRNEDGIRAGTTIVRLYALPFRGGQIAQKGGRPFALGVLYTLYGC